HPADSGPIAPGAGGHKPFLRGLGGSQRPVLCAIVKAPDGHAPMHLGAPEAAQPVAQSQLLEPLKTGGTPAIYLAVMAGENQLVRAVMPLSGGYRPVSA